ELGAEGHRKITLMLGPLDQAAAAFLVADQDCRLVVLVAEAMVEVLVRIDDVLHREIGYGTYLLDQLRSQIGAIERVDDEDAVIPNDEAGVCTALWADPGIHATRDLMQTGAADYRRHVALLPTPPIIASR